MPITTVEKVTHDCNLHAVCNFGELKIRVPRRFSVATDHTAAFAGMEIKGLPDKDPEGQIQLAAEVSFGAIIIQYI